jgi:GGDEF domain-containing protein
VLLPSEARMTFELIPRDNRLLATRVKRQLLGWVSYLMFVGPLAYSVHNGWTLFDYRGLGWFVVAAVAINLVFFVLIRSGYSARFADPSLVAMQVACAGGLALVIGFYLNQARVLTVMLLFTAFFFGVFSFSRRQYLALSAAAALGYAAMLAVKYAPGMRDGNTFRLELLYFMVLVIVLLWLSLIGSYIALLRASLASKKEALASALARLKELASRDELTGLHNRRHLIEILEQQKERADRYREPFAMCILDLDHFKRINDSHGHGAGDEVLRAFAARIRGQMRRMDIIGRNGIHGARAPDAQVMGAQTTDAQVTDAQVTPEAPADTTFGRYGGEEFLLVLPYAADAAARTCVERLRAATAAQPFLTAAGPLRMTFSAGIAHYVPGESIAQMLDRADEALYRAKSAGRDRVEFATPPGGGG